MPMAGAMPYNEPLDPFLADAMKRQRRTFQQSQADPQRSMLNELILAMLPQLMNLGVENIFKLAAARNKANEPMTPLEQAQVRNTDADTKYKEAQTANRADENDPGKQMRDLVAAETLKAGDVAGAQEIAAGTRPPASSPVMAERAREAALARAKRIVEDARSGYGANDPTAAVKNAQQQFAGLMGEVRASHPGQSGEALARDVGEVGNEFFYQQRPFEAELQKTLVRAILANKEGQFGKGQAGVSPRDALIAVRPWFDPESAPPSYKSEYWNQYGYNR